MNLFARQHRRLMLRGIRGRYAYLGLAVLAVAPIPMPVDRDVLLLCAVLGLLANALAHIYMRVTGEHRWTGIATAAIDAGIFLCVIRFTGMVASPFLLFCPAAMFSAHFLFLDRRTAITLEALGIAGYLALAGFWSFGGGSVPGLSAAAYPAFTAVMAVLDLVALALYTFLAFDADLLTGGLDRQREEFRAREDRERLGHSLFAAAGELRKRIAELKLHQGQVEMLVSDLPGELVEEAVSIVAECRDREQEVEDLLDGTIAYARDRMGKPVFAPVAVADLLREAAVFTRLRYGASAAEVRLGDGVAALGTASLDRTWMLQALADLAGDAFARRQAGRPFMVEFDGVERGPTLVLTVRDNGRELLPDELAAMSGAGETDKPGAPSRAPIMARRILEEHGGGLTLDSKPGRGVSFFVILPRGGPDGH